MNKKWIFGFIVITIVLLIFGLYISKNNIGSNNNIKVGIILPLTGEAGNYGKQMLNGAILWKELHPTSNIKLVSADGKGVANSSINAFNKLVLSDGIITCISGFSVPTLAVMPVAVERQILLLNAGATNPQIKKGGRYVFSLVPDADVEADYIAKFLINNLNRSDCFVYWQNDDSGKGMLDVFSKSYTHSGGSIIGQESFLATEIKSTLDKINATGCKTVFIPTSGDNLAKVIRQSFSMGMTNILWVGYAAAESPSLKQELDGYQNVKLIFSTYAFDNKNGKDEKSKDFISAYRKRFGVIPAYYSATCFDAMEIISLAIENGCITSDDISDYIRSIGIFHGVAGSFEIHNGDNFVSAGLSFKKFENGEIVDLIDYSDFNE